MEHELNDVWWVLQGAKLINMLMLKGPFHMTLTVVN